MSGWEGLIHPGRKSRGPSNTGRARSSKAILKPEQVRRILQCRDDLGWTATRIAAALDISLPMVKGVIKNGSGVRTCA